MAPLSILGRLLQSRAFRRGGDVGHGGIKEDPLLAAGRTLRQHREAKGLNLRELAMETRISTPVLEALERGWRDRLPEGAYLRTMLPLIEQRLDLPSGCLAVALPADARKQHLPGGRHGFLQRFTPGSIDVFSTWQGGLLYGGIILGLIYGLNLQQRQLAATNALSLRPITPLPAQEQRQTVSPAVVLLNAFPDIRPLQQASQGLGQAALNRLTRNHAGETQTGVLALNLTQPSRIELQSESGERSQLDGAQGQLVLQLLPPISLQISPAPAPDGVRWNDQPLPLASERPGVYRLPIPLNADGAAPSPPAPAATP
jgi:hypothetical protein